MGKTYDYGDSIDVAFSLDDAKQLSLAKDGGYVYTARSQYLIHANKTSFSGDCIWRCSLASNPHTAWRVNVSSAFHHVELREHINYQHRCSEFGQVRFPMFLAVMKYISIPLILYSSLLHSSQTSSFRPKTTRCVRVVDANALKGACENGPLDSSRLHGRIYIGSYASASPAGGDWIQVPITLPVMSCSLLTAF